MTEKKLLHDFFEDAAERWAHELAVDIPPGEDRPFRTTLTYAKLRERSNKIAELLPNPGPVVGILLRRDSADLIAAQIAVLKSGAGYLCLEPNFPDAQIKEMLADCGAQVLLSDEKGTRRAECLGIPRLTSLNLQSAEPTDSAPSRRPNNNSLAYIIYTSGTTGKPKGVMIPHEGIANLVQSDLAEFGLKPGDRVAQGSSAAYDSSVEEIWLALAGGATVVVMDDDTVRLGPDLVSWLRKERITVLCPPPTLLRSTGCANPEAELPHLRLLYVGGEALTQDVVELWARGRRLVNGYGPTECSVTCARGDVRPSEPITIGKAILGMTAHILDENLAEVASGETGELCFGGAGLAIGYLGDVELTAAKFVEHAQLGRIYRTGDAAALTANGNIACLGRLDSQVKLRGYRIELEAIESLLATMNGVREAACRVQSHGGREDLVAHVVPEESSNPPDTARLQTALADLLPSYMVPSRFATISQLPRTVGGKIQRELLPLIEGDPVSSRRQTLAPRNEVEVRILSAFQTALRQENSISVDDDFFLDLGGSSLLAAKLVSLLRNDPELASIAVRDVYSARTVAGLASLATTERSEATSESESAPLTSPLSASLIQSLWLLLELVLGSAASAFVLLKVLPAVYSNLDQRHFVWTTLGLLAAALAIAPILTVSLAVAAKRLLIGKYTAQTAPVWGSFYVRNWIVQQFVRAVPWRLFEGTEMTCIALRALGAKIGNRVHFHRGTVPITGGWDLLAVGDDVTISQDAALRLVDLDDRNLVIGPITVGNGSTIGVRASLAPGSTMEARATLAPLTSLTSGTTARENELWEGIPAIKVGLAKEQSPFAGSELSTPSFAVCMAASRGLLMLLIAAFPILLLDWIASWAHFSVQNLGPTLLPLALWVGLAAPMTFFLEAIAARLMGRVEEGVISVRSWGYIRVTLKTSLVESAGRGLSGTLFWPIWLRLAGMRLGSNCEISTIIDVVPEMVTIESDCFLADGIYLGPPEIHRGTVSLAKTHLSANTFVGNHAVIPSGEKLPPDILLGVCTVADSKVVRSGTSWFGLPPFELPRREAVELDRSLTHSPSPIRYLNRLFWESLRIVVPMGSAFAVMTWFFAMESSLQRFGFVKTLFVGTPLITVAIALVMGGAAIMLKWLLLGRVKPGVHALWSCWCSRWDFHYVLWGEWARPLLAPLEGTVMLTVPLRMLGMKIGRGAVLGSGFAQVVDPDMITIGDGATVSAMFQAHTFEDRVLKIDRVNIQPYSTLSFATVVLYGADIGAHTKVTANSVVMKGEHLLPWLRYEGAPTRPIPMEPR